MPAAKAAWARAVEDFTWLKKSDRELVQHFCRAHHFRQLAEDEGDLARVARFESMISKALDDMGATPNRRMRRDSNEGIEVSQPEDEFSEFFSTPHKRKEVK